MANPKRPTFTEIQTERSQNIFNSPIYRHRVSEKGVALKYPRDLGSPGQEAFMLFNIIPPVKLDGTIPATEKTIALYLPPTLRSSYSADYTDVEQSVQQLRELAKHIHGKAPTGAEVLRMMENIVRGNHSQVRASFEKGYQEFGDLAIRMGAAGNLERQYEITQGKLVNPHMAMAFTGIPFRSFNFSFQMMARNEAESFEIREIIREFKKAMHPTIESGNNSARYWLYPKNFRISLYTPVDGQLFMFQLDTCALTQCDADYAGSGVPSFFGATGAPVDIRLNLAFKELKTLTAENFTGENNF